MVETSTTPETRLAEDVGRRPAWWSRPAVLFGVAGVAITQPVLDLFGRNPEFFVAGHYSSRQIVKFALVVALAPALICGAATTLASLVRARLGTVVFTAALAALAALFGLVLADSLGIDPPWLALPFGGAVAVGVVWLEASRAWARSLLALLAVGNLVFLGQFLVASPAAELVGGDTSAGEFGTVGSIDLAGPVVFVILDEFPVTTLMRADGTLNTARYPNFGRLAASSTWFRNASSHSPMTSTSVPSILTGRLPESGQLPTVADHPRNLLSLFGSQYRTVRYESVTDLCPRWVCASMQGASVRQALHDGAVAYGHTVLPGGLADRLPDVDHSWGGFGDEAGDGAEATEATEGSSGGSPAAVVDVGDDGYGRWHTLDPWDRSPLGQLTAFETTVSQIGPDPSVGFVHVALPHYPWTLSPWGTRLTGFPHDLTSDPDDPAFDEANVLRYQLHSLQAGAADLAVGTMIDHLQEIGAWDDALVVVTSDHGISLLPPDLGRRYTDRNGEELLRMPLFVKAPGQSTGSVDDSVAQTIDILPSIVDLLSIDTDWTFDGHSLYDGSEPEVDPRVDEDLDPALAIAARHAAEFASDDWVGLAATGPHRSLVGTPVDAIAVGDASAMTWAPDDRDLFGSLPTARGEVPFLLAGSVSTRDGERPPDLVVAVNGTVAGRITPFDRVDGDWRFLGTVGPFYVDGANAVVAYEVEDTALGPVLHPLDDTGG